MRKLKGLGALAAIAAFSSFSLNAAAEGPPTGVVIGVERAFGFGMNSETTETDLGTQSESETTFALGVNVNDDPYSSARLGVDYVMDGGLSVGTGIGFATQSSETEIEPEGGSSTTTDGPSVTGFIFAPRVGYLMMFTPQVGLWPRGGITYVSASAEVTTTDLAGMEMTSESSLSDLALTLEAPLVILPAPSFGFLVAPMFDYGLSRTVEFDGDEPEGVDYSFSNFGIRFGVVGVI